MRGTYTHELKTWPVPFQAIVDRKKRHEVRRDDREEGFLVGDLLRLREWQPHTMDAPDVGGRYTRRECTVAVTFVSRPASSFGGVTPGYVVMSVAPVEDLL